MLWLAFMIGGISDHPRFLVDLALLAIAILGAVLGFLRRWFLRQTARKWPTANATVETYYALDTGSTYTNRFAPVLGYYYTVNGEAYSGSVCLISYGGPGAADAEESGKSWVGAKIVIRYNPETPAESAYLEIDGAPPGCRNYADQPPS